MVKIIKKEITNTGGALKAFRAGAYSITNK
jgi:hypothetical protein